MGIMHPYPNGGWRSAKRAVLAALAAGILGSPPLAGAQESGDVLPITLEASPSKTLPGGVATLKGSTGLVGPSSEVKITVDPPGAAPPVSLTARPASSGEYAAKFADTKEVGTYLVQVTAPDGRGRASTTLVVVPAGLVPSEVATAATALLETSRQAVQAARAALSSVPPSVARDEARARLAEVAERMAEGAKQVPVLKREMTKVFEARATVEEDNPEWDAYMAELDDWQQEAAARTERLRATIRGITAGTERCGTMDRIVEGLTFVSEATNYVHVPIDKSVGYWIDKVPAGFVARLTASTEYKPEVKFVAISVMKAAGNFLAEGPVGLLTVLPELAADAAQLVAQKTFGSYCEKLEGPLSATFLGESFTRQGEPFFDYTTALDGKLVLMYAKDSGGAEAVGMIGYLEGNGRFEVRDNPQPIVRLTPGQVLFHKVVSPPGSGYWDEVGQFSRALLPHSFKIPVKAVLAGDSIVFDLQPAAHDFSEAIQGRSIYVVMPLGGMIPQIINSPIKLQKAYSILQRTVRRHPVLRVTRAGGSTVAEATFARDTTNATGTARVRTKITLKACNPGCLPLPLSFGPENE